MLLKLKVLNKTVYIPSYIGNYKKALWFTLYAILLMMLPSSIVAQSDNVVLIKTQTADGQPVDLVHVVIDDVIYFKTFENGQILLSQWKYFEKPQKVKAWNRSMEILSWDMKDNLLMIKMKPKTHQFLLAQIKDNNGQPLPGAVLQLIDKKTDSVYSGVTDEGGVLRLSIPIQIQAEDLKVSNLKGYDVQKAQIFLSDTTINLNVQVLKQDRKIRDKTGTFASAGKNLGEQEQESATESKKIDRDIQEHRLPAQIYRQRMDSLNEAQPGSSTVLALRESKISVNSDLGDDMDQLFQNFRNNQEIINQRNEMLRTDLKLVEAKLKNTDFLSEDERDKLYATLNRFEKMLHESEEDYRKQKKELLSIISGLRLKILEKEDRIAVIEREREFATKQFQRQFLLFILISLALLVVALLFFYLTKKFRKQKMELSLANEKISRINNSLEEIVTQRTGQLRELNEELDLFFYRSSHDLRRPLLTIIGLNNIANYTVSDPESLDLFKKVALTADYMDKMLRKLMMVSNINRSVDPEVIDFELVFQNIRKNYQNDLLENHIDLHVSTESNIVFKSNQAIIEMIFENIIENSIRFCSTRRDVDRYIHVEVMLNGGNLFVTIEDNGMGIPKEYLSKIFNMFFVGNETSKGNGLGLYITGKAVSKLNGQIQVESESNKYTRFKILIPSWKRKISRKRKDDQAIIDLKRKIIEG
ncbi:MAG: GHKL domain-containing protein [Cyclobacteriaceae bacterium]|nr:GHKL domain-containing protein [Cyclobacteriaceae bacterium]